MTSMPPHHLQTIRSHGGDIVNATRAFALTQPEVYRGVEDVAVDIFGVANEETIAEAKRLIDEGRAASVKAV